MKKIISTVLLLAFTQGQVQAMAVFDAANLGQAIQQVQNGTQQIANQVQQLTEMKNQVMNQLTQIQQLRDQLINLSGVSDIGNLVNQGKQFAEIIPRDLNSLQSFANSGSIQSANKIIDLSSTSINPNSQSGRLFNQQRQQSAVNLAAINASYQACYDRLVNLQTLIDQIEKSPSAKNIADLQARIQAEQLFLSNESNRLAAMAQMQNVQKTINEQKEIETRLQASSNRNPPRF